MDAFLEEHPPPAAALEDPELAFNWIPPSYPNLDAPTRAVVIAWADEVLQHHQKSPSFCDSVRRGFVRYGQWPDHEGQFISYTHQELAARGRAIANAAAAKAKKAKKRRLSDREVLAKERAEVGVFLAEAAGYYGLDKIKMQQLEEVLTLDEVAAKVIDEATGGGAE